MPLPTLRSLFISGLLSLAGRAVAFSHADAAPNSASNPMRIWDDAPAALYNDSYPIGNGRLGAMVRGNAGSEQIQVNEDSFWSGGLLHRVNPDGYETVKRMQSLLEEGAILDATRLSGYGYVGTPVSVQHYNNLGYLTLEMNNTNTISDYERWLDLGDGTSGISYVNNGTTFQREYLASYPDDLIAIRITASQPGAISFSVHLDRGHSLNRWEDYSTPYNGDTIVMGGASSGQNNIAWAAGARVIASGGTVSTLGDYVICSAADEATIYFTTWTSYRQNDPRSTVLSDLANAGGKPYDAVRAAHVQDYQRYISRVSLNLGNSTEAQRTLTTPKRMAAITDDNFDAEVAALYFQFGRYTLISTSRNGSLPPNLQGIWSLSNDPEWGSKYTININLEMNYWPSLTTNLADLTTPLNDLLQEVRQQGGDVAQKMYHARGLVTHHNTDMWGDSAPQDNWLSSTCWPMGATWLITHLMEHYRFTGDTTMLTQNYELFRDAALFALDFLTAYKEWKVTNPSLSPENTYYIPGSQDVGSITLGPTIDNSLLWELLGEVVDVQRALNISDPQFTDQVTALRAQLPPLRMNQYGGIAEWIHDFEEVDPGHRHWSMLWGLYPGSQITVSNRTTFDAAISSIHRRLNHGGGSTAWSRAWSIALSARAFLPDLVQSNFVQQLVNYTLPTSFLATGPPAPFQVDGTFGGPAGIVEALLQSQETVIESASGQISAGSTGDEDKVHLIRLLPAVPSAWGAIGGGSVKGLLARGGFEVDIAWSSDGTLTEATISSIVGNKAYVTLGTSPIGAKNATTITVEGAGTGGFVALPARKGAKFTVKTA